MVEAMNQTIVIRTLNSVRLATLTILGFTDTSIAVAVDVWDEDLNQLPFLLTL